MEKHSRAGRPAGRKTRQAILSLLKQEGGSDSTSLARRLGVSAMAVRQHLYALEKDRLVSYQEEARPVGRPAKRWRLTPAADRFFPDGHAELAVALVGAMKETFGQRGVEKLLAARTRHQVESYGRRVPTRGSLRKRLEALAAIRTDEGYMAEVQPLGAGEFALIENHCPVCAAASACVGLCGAELEVFQAVLGDEIAIERTEHIVSGARRCVYVARARPVRPVR